MVKHSLQLDNVFRSLSDPTRREILLRIASSKNLTVSDIARPYDMSLPAVSKHLRVLETSRLIERKQKGKEHTFSFSPEPIKTVEAYLSFYTKFCNRARNAHTYALQADRRRINM